MILRTAVDYLAGAVYHSEIVGFAGQSQSACMPHPPHRTAWRSWPVMRPLARQLHAAPAGPPRGVVRPRRAVTFFGGPAVRAAYGGKFTPSGCRSSSPRAIRSRSGRGCSALSPARTSTRATSTRPAASAPTHSPWRTASRLGLIPRTYVGSGSTWNRGATRRRSGSWTSSSPPLADLL